MRFFKISKGASSLILADVTKMRHLLGVVPESTGLYSRLTAWENIRYHSRLYGIDDEVAWKRTQLFASRGYATLQVNYRGSGGYGKDFFLAGNKQIGRKMLDDLEDGLAYVKTLNLIDENKIAIYGGSYGGLATLGSLVKTPNLYTCGVDYVGVSNLFTFFKAFPPYWKPYLGQVYEQWYDENSPEDQRIALRIGVNIGDIVKAGTDRIGR